MASPGERYLLVDWITEISATLMASGPGAGSCGVLAAGCRSPEVVDVAVFEGVGAVRVSA